MKDMKKYRRFNGFRFSNHEIFTVLPGLAADAAREMLTVDGTPKRKSSGPYGAVSGRHSPFSSSRSSCGTA